MSLWGKKLHEKNGGRWIEVSADPADFQKRVDAILSTGPDQGKTVVLDMVKRLAETIEHPDDYATIKADPRLKGILLGTGGNPSPITYVLERVRQQNERTQDRHGILPQSAIDSFAEAKKLGETVLHRLRNTEIALEVDNGRLVVTQDGKKLGDLKLDNPSITLDNTIVTFN
ncbi:MAG: hypothetical protein K2Q01_04485, partial [Rickettsiales bacterium]|nr:hypothetical protein [Rickettsiales bacterium]